MKVVNADSFKRDVATIMVKGTQEQFGRVQRAVAMTALKHCVLNTPVDTGRARGGWQVGIDSVPAGERAHDKSGADTMRQNIPQVNGTGHVVNIANNVEYITYLEHGTDKMAPHAMVDRAIISVLQTYARRV